MQQNWKVKRQRLAASAPSNEGFTIDLFDNSLYDPAAVLRPSSSTVRVDHDSAGMLAIQLPLNSCRALSFGILGSDLDMKSHFSAEHLLKKAKKESAGDDKCVKETHMVLREVHRAIFHEQVDSYIISFYVHFIVLGKLLFLFSKVLIVHVLQVFDLVNREAFRPSLGVNVTGIQENYLQLNIGQGASVFISLVPSGQDDQTGDDASTQNLEVAGVPSGTYDGMKLADVKNDTLKKKSALPNRVSFEIYLQQIFHEHAFVKAKDRMTSTGKTQPSVQPVKDGVGFLGHFCMSLAHRIFSNKVLEELENLV